MKINFRLFKTLTSVFFLLCLILNITTSKLKCSDPDFEEIIDYSNIDWDELDELDLNTTRNPDPINLEQLLVAAQQLNGPIWNYTKPPKGRDVLYLIPHKLLAIEYGGVVLNLFYNYTDNMAFTLDEILNLDNNERAFNTFIQAIKAELSAQEASSLMPLFKKSSIQERKGGGLIQFGFFTGPFIFQLNTSIQFSERNFWLNKKDREHIKSLFADTGDSLDTKEFYKYKIGMGDTRIKFGLNTLNMSNFVMDVGFEVIIPTSRISSIPRLKNYNIDLNNFDTGLVEALRSIRDNLITPRLGNGGHTGLGCYLETKVDLFHDSIHWWNRLSFDNFFVAQEDRLIASKQTMPSPQKDPASFLEIYNQYRNFNNPGPATEFIKQFIFPPAYRVTVQPGGILNFVSAVTFGIGRKWNIGGGYDFFFQEAEKFDAIHEDVDPSSLRIEAAALPSSYQHKIFAEVNYIKKQNHWDLNLGLGGDYTISSKRIGEDWTIFLRIGASF